MSDPKNSPALRSVEGAETFHTRFGPYIIAVAFHGAAFFLMNGFALPRPQIEIQAPEPIIISLVDEPVQEVVEPEPTPLPEEEEAAPEAAAAAAEEEAAPEEEIQEELQEELAEAEEKLPEELEEELDPMEEEIVEEELFESLEFEEVGATIAEEDIEEPAELLEDPTALEELHEEPIDDLIEETAEPVDEWVEELIEDPFDEPIEEPLDELLEDLTEEVFEEEEPADLAERIAQDVAELAERLEREKREEVALPKPVSPSVVAREIDNRLTEASINLEAKKWMTTTVGLENGVIRSLDTSNVPDDVAQRVLARYGIKIFVQFMDGAQTGYSFLNQATTNKGTYHNRVGRGVYQVFSFGQAAIARMIQLQRAELRRRKVDPLKTRVVEVVFGIVTTRDGYELGVKRIDFEAIDTDF